MRTGGTEEWLMVDVWPAYHRAVREYHAQSAWQRRMLEVDQLWVVVSAELMSSGLGC